MRNSQPAPLLNLSPSSIAVIGASEDPNKVGGRPISYLLRFGYEGGVYPINPRRDTVQGLRCYPDIESLPEAPELVVVAIAGDSVLENVRACARKGVRTAIVMSSGFGETGEAGARAQAEMVAVARESGMRIVGPNSQGLANFATGAVANFSTMFLEVPAGDGPVAVISQSGATSVVPYYCLRERGIGVRYVLATGNDGDLTVSDLALAVAEDPDIRLIMLYLETITDPEGLARAAAIARERKVPIVALKSGRSESGMAAAKSHTGAILTEDHVVDAFFRRHGIWRVRDIQGLVNATELYLKGWAPAGRRLVVISNSGALCVMCADMAEHLGIPLAILSEKTKSALRGALASFANCENPIDLTAALLGNSRVFSEVLPLLAEDPAADLFLIGLPVAGQGYDLEAFARDTAAFAESTGKPIVVTGTQPSVLSPFRERGIPTFPNETDAMTALDQFSAHLALISEMAPARSDAQPIAIPAGGSRFLSEAQSLALLAEAGLPTVQHRVCFGAEEAIAAFREIGNRVVVKACSAELPHKSEYGLVHLKLDSEDGVRAAYEACANGVAKLGLQSEGVIVARMSSGLREFALGAKLDPRFGPVLMISDGGKYVEALRDFAALIPPCTPAEVEAALMSLRIAPLFKGVRGEPPLDIAALGRVVQKLGDFILQCEGQIASIDVNPVIVGAEGEGAIFVDALIERSAETGERSDAQERVFEKI